VQAEVVDRSLAPTLDPQGILKVEGIAKVTSGIMACTHARSAGDTESFPGA